MSKYFLIAILAVISYGYTDSAIPVQDTGIEYIHKIIYETSDYDLNHDGVNETILLFYDDHKIMLTVENIKTTLFEVESEDAIFGDNPNNTYDCKLYVKGNKLLLGVTYSFVNKYGSSAWLDCYEYDTSNLKKIWSSDEVYNKNIVFDSFIKKDGLINIVVNNENKIMILDSDDKQEYDQFIKFHTDNDQQIPEMELRITPEYIFNDYDSDGIEELITRTVVTCGASPITDSYICIYSFSEEGIHEKDSWFRSEYRNRIGRDFFD